MCVLQKRFNQASRGRRSASVSSAALPVAESSEASLRFKIQQLLFVLVVYLSHAECALTKEAQKKHPQLRKDSSKSSLADSLASLAKAPNRPKTRQPTFSITFPIITTQMATVWVLTCMWSPASTMRVVLLARAKGMMVSHSMACAASSSRMWVNRPAGITDEWRQASPRRGPVARKGSFRTPVV